MTRSRHLALALSCLLAAGWSGQAVHAQSCSAASFSLAPMSPGAPSATENVAVGDSPVFAMTADFDGDGHPDIATANLGSDNVSVAWGNGDGTFAVGSYGIPLDGSNSNGLRPQGLASGDFNADGHLDFVVALRNSNQIALMLGNGARGFTLGAYLTPRSSATPGRVVAADFNDDGALDIAVALDGTYVDYGQPGGIALFFGDGAGHLTAVPGMPLTITGSQIRGLVAGQFSGSDSTIDLAAVDTAHDTLLIYRGSSMHGGYTLTLAQTLNVVSGADAKPVGVAAADVNSDGRTDLLVANWNPRSNGGEAVKPYNDVAVVLQGIDGTLGVADHITAGGDISAVASADFNADGHPDIVTSNAAWSFSGTVRFSDGSGGFGPAASFPAGGNPYNVATGSDFNGDGSPDFVLVNQPSDTLSVYLDDCIPGNHAPVAIADIGYGFTTDKAAAITTANVLANDSDADGDTMHVTALDTAGTLGSVSNNGDGTFHYDPHGAFDSLGPLDTASDAFRYTISDGHGTFASATVTITILGAQPADLSVDALAMPGTIVAGGDAFTVQAVVHNLSNQPAANVQLDIALDDAFVVVDDAGCAAVTGGLHCVLGNFTASQSANVQVALRLPSSATGNAGVQATVAADAPDPTPGNNSMQALRAITLAADASITVGNGIDGIVAGSAAGYTISVANHGPSDIALATVTATAPVDFAGAAWTCQASGGGACGAGGNGDIDDDVYLPSGATLSYSLAGTLAPDTLADSIVFTAAVVSAVNDPVPGNEIASDTDAVTRVGDAYVGIDLASSYAVLNRLSRYVVTVGNHGPSTLRGVTVGSANPTGLQGVVWTCEAGTGAHCGGSGNGQLDDSVDLPPGATVVYTVTGIATLDQDYLDLNASLGIPAGTSDGNSGNDSISGSVPVSLFRSGFEADETTAGVAVHAGDADVTVLSTIVAPVPATLLQGSCNDGTPCLLVIGARHGTTARLNTLVRGSDQVWRSGVWRIAPASGARAIWARNDDIDTIAVQLVDAAGNALPAAR